MASTPDQNPSPGSIAPAAFDANAGHQQRPRIRAVRGFPAMAQGPDGKEYQMLGLADARQISDKVVITMPAAVHLLPLMDGSRDLDGIVSEIGRGLTRGVLEQLVAQLDDAGLIEGPRYEALAAKMRADFDATPILPPGTTAAFTDSLVQEALGGNGSEGGGDGAAAGQAAMAKLPDSERDEIARTKLREVFDRWIDETLSQVADPALATLPKAIVAPHLDYPRGWMNYAAIYGRMRVVDRPDRVVILGTNHFGESTGITGVDKGFSTVLGACELDSALLADVTARLGPDGAARLLKYKYDHEREHSIELQVAWIQHVFGKDERGAYPKIFAALIHDPTIKNGESYDGQGLALDPFIAALSGALQSAPGRTLVVSSADLSHMGPAFGDKESMAGDDEAAQQRRSAVFVRDREMLTMLEQGKHAELVSAMAWETNPTRWCSIGNLVATMMLVKPTKVRVLNYAAAMDEQGVALVSSCAMVMD